MFRTFERSDETLTPPGLRFITVHSTALDQRVDLTLYVPPQVDKLHDVAVVTLLHGVHGSHWAWAFKGGAHITAQRLIDAGRMPPMILAMPSDGLWGAGSGYVPHAGRDFERWIVDEVPAAAARACSAATARSPQFIAGLSMGGFGALRLAGRHAERYRAAAGHSSATHAMQLRALVGEAMGAWSPAAHDVCVLTALRTAPAPLPALRFDCGLSDALLGPNRELHAALRQAGIAHEYAEHEGDHGWPYWALHLADTLEFFGRHS